MERLQKKQCQKTHQDLNSIYARLDHEFIHLGPVAEELELHKYGLEYLYCDPVTFCPHPDGKYFLAHKSVEKTCAEIAKFNQRDADKYREFIDFWQRLTKGITPIFNAPPKSVLSIAGNYGIKNIQDLFSTVGGIDKTLDLIRTMLTSPQDSLQYWFDSEFLKAPLARLAAEFGAPPSQKTIGIGSMMMSMRHNPGMARPRGGTGALTTALVRLVEEKGGVVLCDRAVETVLIGNNGKAEGVRASNGEEYRAKTAVISNIDARRLFLKHIPIQAGNTAVEELRERLDRRIVNNNETILKIDCAMSEAPRFEAYDHREEFNVGSILIADSVHHVEEAHALPSMGKIPDENPSMYLDIPTVLDPSQAPAGKHTMWIEFFAPYQIHGKEGTGLNGTGWTDELKNQVADKVINKLNDYAPNVKDSIIARRVESPAELGERLGAYKGNYYHVDMTLDQMLFFRPLPEIANYTTPVDGLYLTGAGTHPGGSISGMPGRNCARVFLQSQQPIKTAIEDAKGAIDSTIKSMFE